MKEAIKKVLDISDKTYYNWKNQCRPIIFLLEKYFTTNDLQEFIDIGKITRIENNKDQELLNNEASKIYNHFISSLYYKDKDLLKMFLIIINNANENSLNLYSNFIDLVFEAEGKKENKIKLIKDFNKISQKNNILFFYSIKFMVQNGFEKISYTIYDYDDNYERYTEEILFNITYIQISLELFYKKEFISYEEFSNQKKKKSEKIENYSDSYYIPGIENPFSAFSEYDEVEDENFEIVNYNLLDIAYHNSLIDYKNYLKSLILSCECLKINFTINPNEDNVLLHFLNLQ